MGRFSFDLWTLGPMQDSKTVDHVVEVNGICRVLV